MVIVRFLGIECFIKKIDCMGSMVIIEKPNGINQCV